MATLTDDEEIVRRRLAANTLQMRGDYPIKALAKMCAPALWRSSVCLRHCLYVVRLSCPERTLQLEAAAD